jgi:hypothetical protein
MNNAYSGMTGSFMMKSPMLGKIIQIDVKKGGVIIEKGLHLLIKDYVIGDNEKDVIRRNVKIAGQS